MSYRCKPKESFNLDTLTKSLREVYNAGFDHPMCGKTLYYLGQMCGEDRAQVIKHACGKCMTYDQLCNCARSKYVIQKQLDANGPFSALACGDVSVATWTGHDLPLHADEVDVTEICIRDKDGILRCSPMLDFAELWMEHNQSSFRGFLSGINTFEL